MANETKIEWTDATWNPIRGCSRVSEGCRNCYAEKVAYRFSGPGQPYEGLMQLDSAISVQNAQRIPKWNGKIKFVEEHLLDPLRWRRPRRIFVNSMSDLFHPNVTDEMLDRIFAVMALSPQHTFQVLTKRPERMLAYLSDLASCDRVLCEIEATRDPQSGPRFRIIDADRAHDRVAGGPLPNVWLGVSVENQKAADERIPLLLQTPAAVRFISAEPLLGSVDLCNIDACSLDRAMGGNPSREVEEEGWKFNSLYTGDMYHGGAGDVSDGPVRSTALDWVICGGESGPGARPMHPDWARSLRDQCVTAGVPFFFKQWGEWLHFGQREAGQISNSVSFDLAFGGSAGPWYVGKNATSVSDDLLRTREDGWWRVGKKAAGHLLDGKEWHQFPEAR